jgi:hypothetical protein
MRKIAREAVIFCLLGAAIGSAYFLVQQYRRFRQIAAETASIPAPTSTPTSQVDDRKTGPGWDRPGRPSSPTGELPSDTDVLAGATSERQPSEREPSEALILFQQSLVGAIFGFSAGLAVWCAYRLVRFAILG